MMNICIYTFSVQGLKVLGAGDRHAEAEAPPAPRSPHAYGSDDQK